MKGYVARKGNRWYAVIYEGIDPVTGKERRSWHAAGPERADVERLAARLASELEGVNDEVRSLSFGAYLTSRWLPAKRLVLAPPPTTGTGATSRTTSCPPSAGKESRPSGGSQGPEGPVTVPNASSVLPTSSARLRLVRDAALRMRPLGGASCSPARGPSDAGVFTAQPRPAPLVDLGPADPRAQGSRGARRASRRWTRSPSIATGTRAGARRPSAPLARAPRPGTFRPSQLVASLHILSQGLEPPRDPGWFSHGITGYRTGRQEGRGRCRSREGTIASMVTWPSGGR